MSQEQVATAATERMRKAGRWQPNVVPTAQEWVVGFEALNQIQRLAIAERVLQDSARSMDCFVRNHERAVEHGQELRRRAAMALLVLEDVLGDDLEATAHEHDVPEGEQADCRQCGRREVAIRVGIALGVITPTSEPDEGGEGE